MLPSLQQLGIDRLSPEDRLVLIGEIWDSLADEQLSEIPLEHKQALEGRIANADANPDAGQDWEVVLQRLRTRS